MGFGGRGLMQSSSGFPFKSKATPECGNSYNGGMLCFQTRKFALTWSALVAITACGPATSTTAGSAPNVVLISIDSLRADGLGCYGAERATSPEIDAFAAEGALFETVVAPTSWTLPSHVTLLTGLSVVGHRVERVDDRIDANRVLLAEHLRPFKYRTAGFVSAPFLNRAYGFARGFDTYENFGSGKSAEFPPLPASHKSSHSDETASQVIDAAIAWLSKVPSTVVGSSSAKSVPNEPESYFLFVHIWDPHYDYAPPPPFDKMFDGDYRGEIDVSHYESNPSLTGPIALRDREHIRALYDGEIRWVDQHLGRLFTCLRKRADWSHTITTLVADHGEEFFEHDGKGHARTVFEESVRVPWIVVYPKVIRAGTRIPGVVGLEDVAPTLLGLLTAPPLAEATGSNWSSALRQASPAEGSSLIALGTLRALRGKGWKLIADAETGLVVRYDLRADPDEQQPIRATDEMSKALFQRILAEEKHAGALKWDPRESVELDSETTSQLKDLGYIK